MRIMSNKYPDAVFTEEQRRVFVERLMLEKGGIPEKPLCHCERCMKTMMRPGLPTCPLCGASPDRCPRAHDHREPCDRALP